MTTSSRRSNSPSVANMSQAQNGHVTSQTPPSVESTASSSSSSSRSVPGSVMLWRYLNEMSYSEDLRLRLTSLRYTATSSTPSTISLGGVTNSNPSTVHVANNNNNNNTTTTTTTDTGAGPSHTSDAAPSSRSVTDSSSQAEASSTQEKAQEVKDGGKK